MSRWSRFIAGVLFLSGGLCLADDFRYTDVAEILRDDALAIGEAILQHQIEGKDVFPECEFPFQAYGDVQYIHHRADSYHTHTGAGLVGFDLSYRNPILRRTCVLGLFAGGAKDRSHPNIIDNTHNFFGYSGHFRFHGFDIATVSSIGFGNSHIATDFATPDAHFNQFSRHHRIWHSQHTIGYLWDLKSCAIGSEIGIVRDYIKQNGASEWSQNALHHKITDGIFGLNGEIDHDKFYAQLFLGFGHRFNFHTDGGAVPKYDITPRPEIPAQNRFIAAGNLHYALSPKWIINVLFSGNCNRDHKSCSLGIILNHIF